MITKSSYICFLHHYSYKQLQVIDKFLTPCTAAAILLIAGVYSQGKVIALSIKKNTTCERGKISQVMLDAELEWYVVTK